MTATRFVSPQDLSAIAELLKHSHAHVETQIQGGSMGAALPPGARVQLACRAGAHFEPGVVVVYVQDGGLIAHRLVRRGRSGRARDFLITRGDASATCDPPVPIAQAVGVVTGWRQREEQSWEPVGPATHPGGIGAWVTAADRLVIGGLLEIHPTLARAVARLARRLHGATARLRGVPDPSRPTP